MQATSLTSHILDTLASQPMSPHTLPRGYWSHMPGCPTSTDTQYLPAIYGLPVCMYLKHLRDLQLCRGPRHLMCRDRWRYCPDIAQTLALSQSNSVNLQIYSWFWPGVFIKSTQGCTITVLPWSVCCPGPPQFPPHSLSSLRLLGCLAGCVHIHVRDCRLTLALPAVSI